LKETKKQSVETNAKQSMKKAEHSSTENWVKICWFIQPNFQI